MARSVHVISCLQELVLITEPAAEMHWSHYIPVCTYKHSVSISELSNRQKSHDLSFLDAPPQPLVAIKEEVTSRAGSEQGEEEMEVDSADEQEEETKSQGGQAHSQVSRSNNTGGTFNTLSSLGSLRPGIAHSQNYMIVQYSTSQMFLHTFSIKGMSLTLV